MCGIVAVLSRPSGRHAPPAQEVLDALSDTARRLSLAVAGSEDRLLAVEAATATLSSLADDLRGPAGLRCLLHDSATLGRLATPASDIGEAIAALEEIADRYEPDFLHDGHEKVNASLSELKDAWWSVEHDRMGLARGVAELISEHGRTANFGAWWPIQVALNSLGHLEVRGRDSAGLHVLVTGHGLDFDAPDVAALIRDRAGNRLYTSGAVRTPGGHLSLVYKAAAVVGSLGDNLNAIRSAIRSDRLLAMALSSPDARVNVVGHTRWASVGTISEANAHPLNSEEVERPGQHYVVAALNGDIDNHLALRAADDLVIAPQITTDAKVIPTILARRLADGGGMDEAFRSTVGRFQGSVAVAAVSGELPDRLYLALQGSGQSLNIGLAEDAFVVVSEPYGLVEETSEYLRMDGESGQGQIVVLDRDGAGRLGGIVCSRYDGSPLPLRREDLSTAQITSRDIDRRGFDHFLLKELTEAPASFRKTLRGRIERQPDGTLDVTLDGGTIPPDVARDLAAGAIRRVFVIGQGTAAVAARAVAAAIGSLLPGPTVEAMPATELSGFAMDDSMTDTLVVAISQSGTTTDTNRTVDLVRGRGARVVAIVNRRNSDLVSKADGVMYTSDGRDIEMSVASTKAFYAQVAAGWILAAGLARAIHAEAAAPPEGSQRILEALARMPDAMEQVLAQRDRISAIASELAPLHRYWSVVGSGHDAIAAAEIRIKLSELCYRSISADTIEDKKHIDLSSEPLVLVCAASLGGATADDVAKEVAIFLAHKAVPVVISTEAEASRFLALTDHVVTVPAVDPQLALLLSAVVGHLFGYAAAIAIDDLARPLRAARVLVGRALEDRDHPGEEQLRAEMAATAGIFTEALSSGRYNGNLKTATAVQLSLLLRYAAGVLPLEAYEHESGKVGTPATLLSDLLSALDAAVEELTRPVDAIKHQAKTVTVGISRREEELLGVPLVEATLAAGAAPRSLGYRALRTLAALDEAVAETVGHTRYRIDRDPDGYLIATVTDQAGVARRLVSRTGTDPRLRGTKHRAAEEREITVARGLSDGRTVVVVPEVEGGRVSGITLLHVRFRDRLTPEAAKRVLSRYRNRYSALADAVMETEPGFDEARLGREPITDLLTEPVYSLARRWRSEPLARMA